MANTKYTITTASTALSVGGTSITCPLEFIFTIGGEVYESGCEDSNGYAQYVASPKKTVTCSVQGEYGDEDQTMLDALEAGGALLYNPTGDVAGKLEFAGTLIPNGDFTMTDSRTGISVFSASYAVDGFTGIGTADAV